MRTLNILETKVISGGSRQAAAQVSQPLSQPVNQLVVVSKYDLLDIVSTLTGANLISSFTVQALQAAGYRAVGNMFAPFLGAAGYLLGAYIGYEIAQYYKGSPYSKC